MNTTLVLELVKARMGISSTVRDTYLSAIIAGVIAELEDEQGVVLDAENANHQMFVVDYAEWRYRSRDSDGAMPRSLKFRPHNLIVHSGRKTDPEQP